jgi:3alpha(or 20beta)-hydroxysteroid dehydrogenase
LADFRRIVEPAIPQRTPSVSKFDLTGRKALVTGAARGIGAAIAEALAGAGASVAIGDILEDAGRQTAADIGKTGARTAFVKLDVRKEDDWVDATATVVAEFGGFDILVNNAGIEISSLIIEQNPDDLRRMLEINVVGVSLGLKQAFRAMKPGGPAGAGGAVVNISSVAATIPFPAISGYSATKSAVDRLTRVAALEAGKLGYGVRVNCVYPGLAPTAMGLKLADDMAAIGLWPSAQAAIAEVVGLTPLGRLGEVAEMADAVVFLCSDAARFITGAGLSVDGGMGM